ncbi:hypothetical protein GKJPGBOP_04014 [Streptomyces paromomycinus]|uniref:Uncharacterized protein n=2 Tax=Streptomyces paromomycinus TaxID=92743 RepID=A0A401W4R7_STREY|nr:hypothetical protein GKJPGBOP_04014 [Streptomyces paromomycinus]
MRDSVADRTEVLDKVKALALLPDGVHATTEGVASYFVVHKEVVKKVTQRHRAELSTNGMWVLRGSDLREFKRDNMSLYEESYPQAKTNLTLYTRRTILNIAMLLRDSEVARAVRTYLLDVEESARERVEVPRPRQARPAPTVESLDHRLTRGESSLADIGPALRDLGPVIGRISGRLDRLDRRLDATNRVVCAMSERLSDLAEDVRELRSGPRPLPRPHRHPGSRPKRRDQG